jgi:sugar lactone lactonase YvrE
MDVRIVPRDRRDVLGEGAWWSVREGAFYWVDITGRRVNRLDLVGDVVTSWAMPDTIGWLIERERGGWVAGLGRRIVALTLDPLAIIPLAAPEEDRAGNRLNDAKADAAGRIWAGTMPIACDRPSGAFYRLDINRHATRVDDGYVIANGPAIPPAGDFLLHTDSRLRTVFRFAVHDDGSLGQRTPFIVFEDGWGDPDGMTYDADGGLWVACWRGGCVARFDPEGRRERTIPLPAAQVTNVAFAGPALERMFVTSEAEGVDAAWDGALFEIDPGCRGLAPQLYQG